MDNFFCKIHDVDKSTLVFGFQLLFFLNPEAKLRKHKKILGQKCFVNVVSDF